MIRHLYHMHHLLQVKTPFQIIHINVEEKMASLPRQEEINENMTAKLKLNKYHGFQKGMEETDERYILLMQVCVENIFYYQFLDVSLKVTKLICAAAGIMIYINSIFQVRYSYCFWGSYSSRNQCHPNRGPSLIKIIRQTSWLLKKDLYNIEVDKTGSEVVMVVFFHGAMHVALP